MVQRRKAIRVIYSFPLRLGAGRVCTTAWYQVDGLAAAGADVTVFPACISRATRPGVKTQPTLAWGKFRFPNRLLGRMAYGGLHDWIVARRIQKMASEIDIIHAWPVGSLRTLSVAKQLGIPTVLERCNAHTRFAYEVVHKECDRLGVPLPADHEHAWNDKILSREEDEYRQAYRLLCPSEFVVKTFLDKGFNRESLARHIYGYDEKVFFSSIQPRGPKRGLIMISVGVCAVRKGLHYALEAWLQSPAHRTGQFWIAGEFLPAYRQKLAHMLSDPSVKVLGHRNDVPELLRKSDVLVLPSIEEGFGLVCTEAMASGCVPLVSEACTDLCQHMENALVHPIGNVGALTEHITMLDRDSVLLKRLRNCGLGLAPRITWSAAGAKLLDLYSEVILTKAREGVLRLKRTSVP